MPGTIVVAATATGVAPANALLLGGLSVLKDLSGGAFGVPLESIEVTEAGPGGVSSMDFTIDDPTKSIALVEGTEVQFSNVTANALRFRGYVDHWSVLPDFGTGRSIRVSCIGVEAWLDWLIYYPAGVTSNTSLGDQIVGAVHGIGSPLQAANTGTPNGTLGAGIGQNLAGPGLPEPRPLFPISLPAGVTLRETIKTIIDLASPASVPGIAGPIAIQFTVDWYLGVRAWANADNTTLPPTLQQPTDYTTLTVTDTPAGTFVAEGLEFSMEPGDPVHEVYVIGGNAAGTGFFGDGTGVRARQATLSDSSILTAADAQTRATNYFAAQAGLVRGTLTLSDFTPAATVHAGSLLALTDASTGATGTYRIFEIQKTFTGARETWKVAYGGLPPSASRLIRKLTRGVAA